MQARLDPRCSGARLSQFAVVQPLTHTHIYTCRNGPDSPSVIWQVAQRKLKKQIRELNKEWKESDVEWQARKRCFVRTHAHACARVGGRSICAFFVRTRGRAVGLCLFCGVGKGWESCSASARNRGGTQATEREDVFLHVGRKSQLEFGGHATKRCQRGLNPIGIPRASCFPK